MALPTGTPLPSFDGATTWLNSPPLVSEGEGLTLVHFWAVSCPACKMNMPGLQELRATYEPRGLRFFAVHMPRGESDLDIERVTAVAQELGITEPCAIDNEHAIGDRFQTGGVWPIYFLFDHDGKLKRRAAGGFGLKMCRAAILDLFGDSP